jgi:lysophospholipid acyltransferase (LPLAT)-like uncharacterized protein
VAGDTTRPAGAPRRSGIVQPHQPRPTQRAAARLIFWTLQTISATWRWHWDDQSGLFERPTAVPVIFSIWHNRLALSMGIFHRYIKIRQPQRRLAALVSASKDGALLARALENFGVQPVRGSTSRRGPQALLELTRWAEQHYDLAITPDGPRGPKYVVQLGVIALAQVTQTPIVPVVASIKGKWKVKSWDAFQVPLPMAQCRVNLLPPIQVPRNASDTEREECRAQLEQTMRQRTVD